MVPHEEAVPRIKEAVERTYGKRGRTVVERNFAAIDTAIAALERVDWRAAESAANASAGVHRMPPLPDAAPAFVQRVTAAVLRGEGEELPVSALPVDGEWPTGTAKSSIVRSVVDQLGDGFNYWMASLALASRGWASACCGKSIRIAASVSTAA